jgi:phosphatidate cytidylyltransferase
MALSPDSSNGFITRSVSGAVICLAVLGGIYLGNPWWYAICLCISILSLSEFYRITGFRFHVSRITGYPAAFFLVTAAAFSSDSSVILPILAVVPLAVLFIEIARRHLTGSSHGIASSCATPAGLLYIVLPWSFLVILRDHIWGMYLLTALFACTWSCDVAAYLVGSHWGKTRLCPSVSPKKSIEGFAGGLAGSILCGGGLSFLWGVAPLPLVLIALICGTFGQAGDLAESLIKREAGVKDSGDLIPGHGGFLDRFDSILVSSVLVFAFFGVLW